MTSKKKSAKIQIRFITNILVRKGSMLIINVPLCSLTCYVWRLKILYFIKRRPEVLHSFLTVSPSQKVGIKVQYLAAGSLASLIPAAILPIPQRICQNNRKLLRGISFWKNETFYYRVARRRPSHFWRSSKLPTGWPTPIELYFPEDLSSHPTQMVHQQKTRGGQKYHPIPFQTGYQKRPISHASGTEYNSIAIAVSLRANTSQMCGDHRRWYLTGIQRGRRK